MEEKAYIYFTEIKEVHQKFNFKNQPVINMVFHKEAAEKLRNISLKFEGHPLVIVFGKKIIMAPTLRGPIENRELQLSGNFTLEETMSMVNYIKNRIEH